MAVENCPCETIIEVIKRGAEGSDILPTVGAERPWDVFPEEPFWMHFINQSDIRERKTRSFIIESLALSGD